MNRRPPPPFLRAELAAREWLTPRIARMTLVGPDLRGLEVTQPASSVRVLLPDPERPERLEVPRWDRNRFLLRDGSRPLLRTLTPRPEQLGEGLLQVDVVVHGRGAASQWGSSAPLGSRVAVSGPARGYAFDPAATELIVGGDETAFAAVTQIVESVPEAVDVSVLLETPGPDSRPPLPGGPRCSVRWVDADVGEPGVALVEAMGLAWSAGWSDRSRLWAAGEAAAVQRLRNRLFTELGVPRPQATIRGYWKRGRSATEEEGES